jgi:pepF/M3 family oligoendopeptidase
MDQEIIMKNESPSRWNLENVYPDLESEDFRLAFDQLQQHITGIDEFLNTNIVPINKHTNQDELSQNISKLVNLFNEGFKLSATIRAYLNSFVSTDSFNIKARQLMSEYEQIEIQLKKLETKFKIWLGQISEIFPQILGKNEVVNSHEFFLKEASDQSKFLMSEDEEVLAADLHLSGANAWGKLQGTITSQLSVEFEINSEINKISMPALINLRSHPDGAIRERAYHVELAKWEEVREPLASSLNGVKGTVNTLNKHRGRTDALHSSLDTSRIDRETLYSMLDAMRESFPKFRKYFKLKANRVGKEQLPWWDIFAPIGMSSKSYKFSEAREFILDYFNKFSPDLASFSKRAFDNNWIDAEQRVGKRGGAFCMGVPGVKESRILCNYDGSIGQVFTIAHELGHAFHNDCMFNAGRTEFQRRTPMTLAETASIMCETIMVDAALEQASNRDEELGILETSLISDAQVIVDIYSRFLFEKEVFERREKAELSADDFCEIMERAQLDTYGDGLDPRYLHKYMWTWKPHYYYAGLSFYNYPYAFGLLFGLGLYGIYQQRGPEFVPEYKNLLSSTGQANVSDLAAEFGINIMDKLFWESSLELISSRIERYVSI